MASDKSNKILLIPSVSYSFIEGCHGVCTIQSNFNMDIFY